eukprot:TRINITY_DN64694_c0_g1_i1.p1 TRINITY_DN64694_c0_g1~~TRINITY_DN64694_c0_g1_i1.p1  ORF type:complete len:260 (-),score=43.95 TRINITY_DN64694_c0_g1_i1:323-1102(-)
MIHVFNGADACTKPCRTKECVTPICGYAIFAVVFNAIVIFLCIDAVRQQDLAARCPFPAGTASHVGISSWLKVQMACAWLHLLFPAYLRSALKKKAKEALQEHMTKSGWRSWLGGGDGKYQDYMAEGFKQVLFYDFAACIYLFTAVFSLVWSVMGFLWMSDPDCPVQARSTTLLGALYFFCLFGIMGMLYCCLACTSLAPVRWLRQLPSLEEEVRTTADRIGSSSESSDASTSSAGETSGSESDANPLTKEGFCARAAP